jgi:hypothetical protein
MEANLENLPNSGTLVAIPYEARSGAHGTYVGVVGQQVGCCIDNLQYKAFEVLDDNNERVRCLYLPLYFIIPFILCTLYTFPLFLFSYHILALPYKLLGDFGFKNYHA